MPLSACGRERNGLRRVTFQRRKVTKVLRDCGPGPVESHEFPFHRLVRRGWRSGFLSNPRPLPLCGANQKTRGFQLQFAPRRINRGAVRCAPSPRKQHSKQATGRGAHVRSARRVIQVSRTAVMRLSVHSRGCGAERGCKRFFTVSFVK